MDISSSATSVASAYSYSSSTIDYQYQEDALVLQATLDTASGDDSSVVDINRLTQGLSVTADQVLQKLNELLAEKVPGGIQSLNRDDYTPERTASSVVDSITALYSNYVKSNPELSPEEALTRFMAAARSGVDTGYGDAAKTLEGIGAFQFDGVQSGIEKTKELIASKLNAFEEAQRKQLEQASTISNSAASSTSTAVLTQAGISVTA